MKAESAGVIIGKAMEDWSPGSGKEKIVVYVNTSWYDPSIKIGEDGILVDRTNGKAIYEEIQTENLTTNNLIVNTLTTVNKITASLLETSSAVVNLLQTNTADIVNLTVQRLNSTSATVRDLVATTFKANTIEVTDELVSPLIETDHLIAKTIDTDLIRPIADEIEIQGDASLSGTLTASEIKAQTGIFNNVTIEQSNTATDESKLALDIQGDTSVAGTLYAKRIVSDEVITEKITVVERIQEIINRITAEDQTQELYAQTIASGAATVTYDELMTLLQQAEQEEQINSLNLDSLGDIDADNLSLTTNLYVYGQTNLADAFVTGTITQGATFQITGGNSINVLNGTLYLQSLSGDLNIADGAVTIDRQGNAVFAGNLTVKGELATNTIKPASGSNLTVDLNNYDINHSGSPSGFGRLLVKGNLKVEGDASIAGLLETKQLLAEAASISGELTADSLKLSSDLTATYSGVIIAAAQTATQSGIMAPSIKTNGTTGVGILPAGETEVVVFNNSVANNKLIYLTPTSDTINKVVYVKSKKEKSANNEGYFVVAIDSAIDKDITFNWWIIN